jgi:predicted dinucleotide-binding enzyme
VTKAWEKIIEGMLLGRAIWAITSRHVSHAEVVDMRIGILGSGLMGGKLGTIFARAGHDVVFSYSRSERKLKRLARDAQGHARAGTPREAAQHADTLLLAVHCVRFFSI